MNAGTIAAVNASTTSATVAAAHVARIKRMIGPVAVLSDYEFQKLLKENTGQVLAHSHQGFWGKSHHYLINLGGLTWYCTSDNPLDIPNGQVVVEADKISVPQ